MATTTKSPSGSRPKTFDEALHQLDASLESGVGEFTEMVSEEYASVRANLMDMKNKITKASAKIDSQLRNNPWPMLGCIGAGALVLGVLIGSNRKGRS